MQSTEQVVQELVDKANISGFQKQIFFICSFCAMLDGFDLQSISFAAPALISEYQVTSREFGIVIAIGLVGVLLGAIIQGPFSDRIGRKPLIFWSLISFGSFSIACAFAETIEQMMALRFLIGFPIGMLVPNIISLTSEYSPTNRKFLIVAIVFSGFPLGAFIGGLISAILLPRYGWESVFLLAGVLPVFTAFAVRFALPESVQFLFSKHHSKIGSIKRAQIASELNRLFKKMIGTDVDVYTFKNLYGTKSEKNKGSLVTLFAPSYRTATLLIWTLYASTQFGLYILISWLPVLMSQTGSSIQQAILPLSFMNLGAVLGGACLGYLGDRFGGGLVLFYSYIFGAVVCGLSILLFETGVVAIVSCSFIIGFAIGGGQLTSNGLATGQYPTSLRSTGVGGASFAGRIGGISASLIGGYLLTESPTGTQIFLFAGLACLISSASAISLSITNSGKASS